MSHIVTINTEVRSAPALSAACRRLELPTPKHETVQLFSSKATGHCVRLPDWRYPVVCQLDSGRLQFDNYEGRWGEQRELDRLMQAYACEAAKLTARRQGHGVAEQTLADGSIKLTIQVGAAT